LETTLRSTAVMEFCIAALVSLASCGSSTSTHLDAGTSTGSASDGWSSGTCGRGTAAFVLNSNSIEESDKSYSATATDESAICITGTATSVTLTDPIVATSGATSSTDESSFYGLDAAVLDYDGGDISISGGTITTSGQGGNAIFAYGSGKVTISNTIVSATGANAHGLYAAGGGQMVVTDATASTTGSAASVVATDRGGGTITITGGRYTSAGQRSAGIYSTGTVAASNATFGVTNAEAVVVEGSNSATLNNATITAVSGTSEHRGVFLYQSMSGDATSSSCGTGACLAMTGGSFLYSDTTNSSSDATANCAAFAVANQVAHITLTDVTITNKCPTFLLSALNPNWNYKGGDATVAARGVNLTGDVIVDSVSTANITLASSSKSASTLTGAVNGNGKGSSVSLTLDSASRWIVTGTSHLTALTDADAGYHNITCQISGCKVYVGANPISIN